MKADLPNSPTRPPEKTAPSSAPAIDPIAQNTDSILAFNTREERHITASQRALESIGDALGSPTGLGAAMSVVAAWIAANALATHFGLAAFDPPPYSWLQGFVGLAALFTTIVILVKQNRLAKMEERRAHLELHVNLLTEQKATKLINLMEELRRDLPMIKDRHDAEAFAFQSPADPESVIASLDTKLGSAEL
jgi:uncharacterized membrane protein